MGQSFRRHISCKRHRCREDRYRSEAAQLCHPQVLPRTAYQKWQENRSIRSTGWCLNFIDENDEVLIAGFGRRGHAVGDIPGVRFKVVKVAGCGLNALYREKKEKPRS